MYIIQHGLATRVSHRLPVHIPRRRSVAGGHHGSAEMEGSPFLTLGMRGSGRRPTPLKGGHSGPSALRPRQATADSSGSPHRD